MDVKAEVFKLFELLREAVKIQERQDARISFLEAQVEGLLREKAGALPYVAKGDLP